jgi:hypothetical protein
VISVLSSAIGYSIDSFTLHIGEADTYRFRIKFAQGDTESPCAQTNQVKIIDYQLVHLPSIRC